MADIRLSIPNSIKAGEIIELKAMIRHNMESGYRRDIQGQPIPRNILEYFECRLDDTIIFSVDLYPGVSANPLIKFYHKAEEAGVLTFSWREQTGQIFSKSADLVVA